MFKLLGLQIQEKIYGLHKITLHGEGGSAPLANIDEERPNIQQILSDYDPEYIYNAEETGLFYRMEPNQTCQRIKVKLKLITFLNLIFNFCYTF